MKCKSVWHIWFAKREKKKKKKKKSFFCQWLPRDLVVDTNIYYRLLERRAFDLSRPRALRAPGSV